MRIPTTIEKLVPTAWKASGLLQTFYTTTNKLPAALRVNASETKADSTSNSFFSISYILQVLS